MKSAKKIVVAMLCVMFIFSVLNIQEAGATSKSKDKCYKFYYSWSCVIDGNYDYLSWDYEYVKLLESGGYFTSAGWYGAWYTWKGTIMLRQVNGCQKLITGNKKMGFFMCTDGLTPVGTYAPGCWYMKKVKCTIEMFG